MTPDREQIRRDALMTTRIRIDGIMQEPSGTLAEHCLALLAELEQAERETGEAINEAASYINQLGKAERRAVQAERERDEALERTRQADRLSADLREELQRHGLRP